LADIRAASINTSPFLMLTAERVAKGAGAGLLIGTVFFKSTTMRKSAIMYGAGVGIGMSWQQVRALFGALNGTVEKTDEDFYTELWSI